MEFRYKSSKQLQELWDEIATTLFTTSTENSVASASSFEEDFSLEWMSDFEHLMRSGIPQQISEEISKIAKETMANFTVDNFKDEKLKIALLNIKFSPWLFVLFDDYFNWWEDDFEDMTLNKNICHYQMDRCNLKYTDVQNILKKSNDSEEILYYWLEWRDKNKEEAKKKLKIFSGLHNKAATEIYNVTSKYFWFVNYKDENFLDEMEKVVKELKPLYKELYGYVRNELVKEYGEEVVSPNGTIPHHLFEQILRQVWQSESVISKYFKDVQMPVKIKLPSSFLGENKLLIADDVMKSMGLEELDNDFHTGRTKMYSGDDCNFNLYCFSPKTYLQYCEHINIKQFFQLHGDFAKIHYVNQKKDLPYALFDSYNFEYPVSEAVILSAASPSYLNSVGIMNEPVLTEKEDMSHLFRMGIHTIFSIPAYYINSKVVSDLLDGSVDADEINKHYWKLMKENMGVDSPLKRNSDSIDFSEKFYGDFDENHQADKFISEVIGYQFYKSLCKKSGQYIEGDDSHQLHNCNFFGNKEAGKVLKDMMKLGGSKPWKQLMRLITGDENGMKADGLLEYYKPLQDWLKNINKENEISIEW